jgi:2,4-dienoyl-CoA reductase-like NADH-dependent reductase (Old Yellow Enzyme family)
MDPLLNPGRIGSLDLRTRLVRAGTSETMATETGLATDELVALYERLARSRLGLLLTGHLYCHPRGQYARRQTGIYSDDHIPGLRRLTDAVHRHGVPIFAQVAHAGSQSRVVDNRPLAPSPVPNALTGREVGEATGAELEEAVAAFAAGARRAMEAGFDGVHVHAANGYLISELSSPLANRRTDEWGGSPAARDRFVREVVRAVRGAIGDAPLTVKLGMADAVPGGLDLDDRARPLIREPDLAAQIEAGRDGRVDCTSCNICLMHEGRHALRCWRIPRRRLLAHAALRLAGRTT